MRETVAKPISSQLKHQATQSVHTNLYFSKWTWHSRLSAQAREVSHFLRFSCSTDVPRRSPAADQYPRRASKAHPTSVRSSVRQFQTTLNMSQSWLILLSALNRAIENGANALAEGFLFSVAATLILGETWRTSRNQSKRRDSVDDHIDELQTKVLELDTKVREAAQAWENQLEEEKQRYVRFRIRRIRRLFPLFPLADAHDRSFKARGALTNTRTSSRNRTAWWIGRAPRYTT
jgi:hypothetical protein